MQQLPDRKRECEFDVMRTFAMFAVIVTHTCGVVIHDLSVNSLEFIVMNVLRGALTWDVPLFVMISGRFFLDPEKNISISKIFRKYISHIVIAFCIWSAIYTAFYIWRAWDSGENIFAMWKQFFFQFLTGPYHMWYVFMIIGLYMATPILRKITQDKKLMEYFIVLFIVSQVVVQYGTNIPVIENTLTVIISKTDFHIALGYCGYYILGYYLYKYGIPAKFEKPMYILTVLLILFACVGKTVHSIYDGEENDLLSKYLMPNVIVESCGVYLFFLKAFGKLKLKTSTEKIFIKIGKWGFGVYLSHAIVIEFLDLLGMSPMFAFPLGILIMSVCTFAGSLLLVFIIDKIPVLNKYLM